MNDDLKPCPFCGKIPEGPIDATRVLGVWRLVHRGCCTLPNFAVERSERGDTITAWNRRAEATSALLAKDAENARLRGLLAEAVELTDAWIDPRYGTPEEWDWREDVLSRMKAETANRDG